MPFSADDFKRLSQVRAEPAVSLYISTHEAGKDTRENPIRFKNQLHAAEEQLTALGYEERDVTELLAEARALVDDNPFWQHQRQGLAMFVARGVSERFLLPIAVPTTAVVGTRFHLKPLIPLLANDGRFFLLAVGLNGVRFFEGTRFDMGEVDLGEVPRSLDEALRFDDPERSLQHHATSRAPTDRGGGRADVAFHGTGAGDDDRKNDVLRFFQQLDNGVRKLLGADTAPLLFWGVDYLFPLYRQANHYPHLLDEAIEGNPERIRPEELHERAWQAIAPHFGREQHEALDRYRRERGGERALEEVRTVLPASFDGRVDTLLFTQGTEFWGSYDPDKREVDMREEAAPGDEELVDLAAIQTLLHGGSVYMLDEDALPEGSPLGAVLRY